MKARSQIPSQESGRIGQERGLLCQYLCSVDRISQGFSLIKGLKESIEALEGGFLCQNILAP